MSVFEPIAIVGRGCTVPDARDPDELFRLLVEKRSALSVPPPELLRAYPDLDRDGARERAASLIGGYMRALDPRATLADLALPEGELRAMDVSFHWVVAAARQALETIGHDPRAAHPRAGVVLGSLGYPTHSLRLFAEGIWSNGSDASIPRPDPRVRFSSGLPAHTLARALGMAGPAFSLDAACASSLYAVKLACDRLHARECDLMLAGGVNGVDPLFMQAGFIALSALSPTGQSRPFHRDADGLVPAWGAGLVALERLADARAAGHRIFGVIRAVAMANDGRSHGLLVPSQEGQVRTMAAAYRMSGLTPADISLVECHATGTRRGDEIEVLAMRELFRDVAAPVGIGSLKGNLGHLLTASGAASLVKILGGLERGILPPTLHAEPHLDALDGGPLRLVTEPGPWESRPRRAAINNFGFGGNNTHLLVEEPDALEGPVAQRTTRAPTDDDVAVVAVSVQAGGAEDFDAFSDLVLRRTARDSHRVDVAHLDPTVVRFPPNDLRETLPQQLLVLSTAMQIADVISAQDRARTSVLIGMQCDPEAARIGGRFRTLGEPRGGAMTAAGVVGAMPNVVSNRISSQFDLSGPSYSVFAEEVSGLIAFDLAMRALGANEIDAAVVGAVDLSCEPAHRAAAAAMLGHGAEPAGDAAVVLVLKRVADARKCGDPIHAVVSRRAPADVGLSVGNVADATNVTPTFGHAHAASGLLHLAAAIVCCEQRLRPGSSTAEPWLPNRGVWGMRVAMNALGGRRMELFVRADATTRSVPTTTSPPPRLQVYSASTRAELIQRLANGQEDDGRRGPVRLAIASTGAEEAERARVRALHALPGAASPEGIAVLDEGAYFAERPLGGEVAFVFTGPAGAYPGMGRDLVQAVPELVDRVQARFTTLREAAGWIYFPPATPQPSPEERLWASGFLSLLHAELTRHLLGIEPQAVLGICAGESHALFAMDVWGDIEGMYDSLREHGVFTREIAGAFEAVARSRGGAGPVDWSTWRLLAPVDDVRAALAAEPTVHLAIIQAADDVVITGDAAACRRVVAALGETRARYLGYDVAIHCPEARSFAATWRELHRRPVRAPAARFYSHATCSAYALDPDSVAAALTQQAMHTVDFPRLVTRAASDGVRIFVEHGQHAGCSKWIDKTLAGTPHLAVALDSYGRSSLAQVVDSVARLVVAGVPVDVAALQRALARCTRETRTRPERGIAFPAHWPPVRVPRADAETAATAGHVPLTSSRNRADKGEDGELMEPAPARGVASPRRALGEVAAASPPAMAAASPPGTGAVAAIPAAAAALTAPPPSDPALRAARRLLESLSEEHRRFVQISAAAHADFLAAQANAAAVLVGARASDAFAGASAVSPVLPPAPAPASMPVPAPAPVLVPARASAPAPVVVSASRSPESSSPPSSQGTSPNGAPAPPLPVAPPLATLPAQQLPRGLRLDRAQLEAHASGRVSDAFGPAFRDHDDLVVRVRMPEPPLLLADRVIGMDAEPGSMGSGIVWTETDVGRDAWYLHQGRVSPGILIEAGQADMLLISYLGIDRLNRGERAYRLLGCELMYHDRLPLGGDQLSYEIHVGGHTQHENVRLFFFDSDAYARGRRRLSVRHGQAGFFTADELANARGVLWRPEQEEPTPGGRCDPPAFPIGRRSFDRAAVRAFAEGRPHECFGPELVRTRTHTRTPRIPSGRMQLVDEVTAFDPKGGPWGRGYLRAVLHLEPDTWFFPGHFTNDPCMPGTLMIDACMQAMAFYLTALGYTTTRDGWVFEPTPEETMRVVCRGQVVPTSKELVCELFVDEVIDGPEPTLRAAVLGTVDGQPALHCPRLSVQLRPGWPIDDDVQLLDDLARHVEPTPVASVGGIDLGYRALLHAALGKPSDSFGELYRSMDGPGFCGHLPSPPYHFISRVLRIEGRPGTGEAGLAAEVEYDVPARSWYFDTSRTGTMPFAVILEVALQPCGWLSFLAGLPLTSERPLYFRNLDGRAIVHRAVRPGDGPLGTRVELKSVAKASGVILVGYSASIRIGQEPVFDLETSFGFFDGDALSRQTGLPTTEEQALAVAEPSAFRAEPTGDAAQGGATPRLRMLDELTGIWPEGGAAGMGRARGRQRVDPDAWYFKAHFLRDPVQPGSLGLSALLELLEELALQREPERAGGRPCIETPICGEPVTWKYRGQVLPENHEVVVDLDLTRLANDERGTSLVANGSLWVDGTRIYEAAGLSTRISSLEHDR
jgi:acyl transferase domain-containing protein/3-hydroxymyristoyl/3-hydroxydecanoyl-(acyl carrier protein) dehydratase